MAVIVASLVGRDILSCVSNILTGETFTVSIRRQMRVFQKFTLSGTVIINGELVIEY